MSRNMSTRTNTADAWIDTRYMSTGMPDNSYCKVCGMNKGTKEHKAKADKCSRELQRRSRAGEI